MTREPDIDTRRGGRRGLIALMVILAIAAGLRLHGLAFGLPALYDPDEVMFEVTALKLLAEKTINPGWFGHPGTTTIYALAIVNALTFLGHQAAGSFASVKEFAEAVYLDPSLIVLPGRVLMLASGLFTILLTERIGTTLFGRPAGLLAAGLLAVDAVHIKYSQIIRPDMHATIFILLTVLAAIRVARAGRLRDYVWAGLWLGVAVASKWPAVAACAGIAGAALLRAVGRAEPRRVVAARLAAAALASVMALLIVSPYLLIDHATVIDNLRGEARGQHLGSTSLGPIGNLVWYVERPLTRALGVAGLLLAALGFVAGSRAERVFLAVVVPVTIAFSAIITTQGLVWERWLVPLLPLVTIATAVGIMAVTRAAAARFGARRGRVAGGAVAALVAAVCLWTTIGAARERVNDTRRQASDWAIAHIPDGSSVLVEHWAFDLLAPPWRLLFPLGDAGCIVARQVLTGGIDYKTVKGLRRGEPLVDVGTINPARIDACRAHYAILVDYDRYRAEADRYPQPLAIYRRVLAGGTLLATFRPREREVGGPIVRVVRLRPGFAPPPGTPIP